MMPSSTDERRARMNEWFGDFIDEQAPMMFLESRGYRLTRGWEWEPPVSAHTPNFCERECILFLIEEWDFGGLANPVEPVDRKRFRKAPCYICGYNGSGYFQPDQHKCAEAYHAAAQAGGDHA